jgi:SAM-dependent methyltransferase
MTDSRVEAAYTKHAAEYAARFGSLEATHPADRRSIADWVAPLVGPVLDVGCAPGHWTKFLADRGAAVEGIDLVPWFIEQARESFPGIPFRVAPLMSPGVPDGYASGILAWYSLIHLEPGQMAAALQKLARSLAPGGRLLLGMFEGDRIGQFPHAVTPAYAWPVEQLTTMLAAAGFETISVERRVDPGQRPHAAISAALLRAQGADRVARSPAKVVRGTTLGSPSPE